jgi:hypothetical protein
MHVSPVRLGLSLPVDWNLVLGVWNFPRSGRIVANMTASTVAQYLAALPADRRAALSAVRKAINENLPDGYEEGMQFGMIGWYVPLSVYPAGYGENPKVPLSCPTPPPEPLVRS